MARKVALSHQLILAKPQSARFTIQTMVVHSFPFGNFHTIYDPIYRNRRYRKSMLRYLSRQTPLVTCIPTRGFHSQTLLSSFLSLLITFHAFPTPKTIYAFVYNRLKSLSLGRSSCQRIHRYFVKEEC